MGASEGGEGWRWKGRGGGGVKGGEGRGEKGCELGGSFLSLITAFERSAGRQGTCLEARNRLLRGGGGL